MSLLLKKTQGEIVLTKLEKKCSKIGVRNKKKSKLHNSLKKNSKISNFRTEIGAFLETSCRIIYKNTYGYIVLFFSRINKIRVKPTG